MSRVTFVFQKLVAFIGWRLFTLGDIIAGWGLYLIETHDPEFPPRDDGDAIPF